MKLRILSITISIFLLTFLTEVQAQNLTPKLDQLKLMEDLWVGECQLIISKDSLVVSELIQYGKVFVYNAYLVVDGKKYFRFGGSYVFSLKEDNFKGFAFTPNGNYQTWIGSFVTEKKMSMDMVQNFNPEKVLYKEVVEWENPTNYTIAFFDLNGKKTGGSKWTKKAK
jgi:hypothetical protein